jgi:adenylate kinase family enzyme
MTLRIVVIGNSGSGKSTLASRLAAEHGIEHLDLDTLAWQPTHPPERVPLEVAEKSLRRFADRNDQWVVEGCYADLVELLLPEATELVFLDLPVDACRQNARTRPWEPHKYPSKQEQDANLEMLLEWISAYPEREGVLGRRAHRALFDSFAGTKQRRVE